MSDRKDYWTDEYIEELQTKIKELESLLSSIREENRELKKEVINLKLDVQTREKRINEANRFIDDLAKEKNSEISELRSERDELKRENENLCSVMIAAAEEIQEHWQAHCDKEGYGPANLMMRLEKGIPANYPGYKFGEFTKMQEEIDRLKKNNQEIKKLYEEDTRRLKAMRIHFAAYCVMGPFQPITDERLTLMTQVFQNYLKQVNPCSLPECWTDCKEVCAFEHCKKLMKG